MHGVWGTQPPQEPGVDLGMVGREWAAPWQGCEPQEMAAP